MGSARLSDYVDWAVSELVAGVDTPNLRILAGLPKPPYWPEVVRYFELALADLNWSPPEPRDYLRQYARRIAQDIIAGNTPPLQGRDEIWEVSQALRYPASLVPWLYLDECMDPRTCRELEGPELETAIRHEAELLLQDPDAP